MAYLNLIFVMMSHIKRNVLKTADLIAEELNLTKSDYEVAFQSRFGKAEWIKPYLSSRLEALPAEGVKNIHVFCPGFSSDCLETIDEIGRESKEEFFEHGGDSFEFIPCLNSDENFIEALMDINSSKKLKFYNLKTLSFLLLFCILVWHILGTPLE